jgi:hypothetical protein
MQNLARSILVLFFSASAAAAERESLALGLGLGAIVGPSIRYSLSSKTALTSTLGWDDGSVEFVLDHVWFREGLIRWDGPRPTDGYWGAGLLVDHRRRSADEVANPTEREATFGLRAPAGLRHIFRDPRIEVFGEVALHLTLTPSTSAGVGLLFGGRFIFP